MKLKEVVKILEDFAPVQLQESYDNAGLIVGNPEANIKGVLCTVDITESVLNEALSLGANFIISHHPIIFQGIKSITGKTENEKILIQAIKNDIAIYSAHTNLDNVTNGVNQVICDKLGLKGCKILQPLKNQLLKIITFVPIDSSNKVREAMFNAGAGKIGNYDSCSFNIDGQGTFRGNENTNPFVGEKGKLHFENETKIETIVPKFLVNRVVSAMIKAHPYEEIAYDIYPLDNEYSQAGAGMIGHFEKAIEVIKFLDLLKDTFKISVIKYSGNHNINISKVAVCGGSGSFLINEAIKQGAQALVTGDIKYHQFFDAGSTLLLCDIGHYESEQFTKEIFYSLLIKKISTFAVHLSIEVTNPIKYY
jgi:dinuclear metal center YbgI/SA1388 family protein